MYMLKDERCQLWANAANRYHALAGERCVNRLMCRAKLIGAYRVHASERARCSCRVLDGGPSMVPRFYAIRPCSTAIADLYGDWIESRSVPAESQRQQRNALHSIFPNGPQVISSRQRMSVRDAHRGHHIRCMAWWALCIASIDGLYRMNVIWDVSTSPHPEPAAPAACLAADAPLDTAP